MMLGTPVYCCASTFIWSTAAHLGLITAPSLTSILFIQKLKNFVQLFALRIVCRLYHGFERKEGRLCRERLVHRVSKNEIDDPRFRLR